ncbi:MAG: cytochrome c biogenesis protein ResB [Bdellovibrionaceae bacterium]|nr:cytochrome c biogenesis protein ResB [Pseudobdellovibrionaceae bacterium]
MNGKGSLSWSDRIVKSLASLKLAVFVILALATITAVGTFVESSYNAPIAKKWVYDTLWMYAIMGLLCVNLIAVMVDRWPWKRRHIAFVSAHIGILVLLFGSFLTWRYGLDGSLRVGIGQSNRFVTLPETDFSVWTSFDGDQFAKLMETPVDFDRRDPKKHPVEIVTDAGPLKITAYRPFVVTSRKVIPSDNPRLGPALRFQVVNSRVNVIEWLVQKRDGDIVEHDFGPAKVFFGEIPQNRQDANEVFFKLRPDGALDYKVFYKDEGRKPLTGVVKEGDNFNPGWMDLEFRVLRVFAKAEETWDFQDLDRPTELSNSAIEVDFQGKKHWLQLNDTLKMFTDRAVYIVAFGNRRVDLGFDVFLKKFEVGRYQGTMRAASYASLVEVPGVGEQMISMNEPLKHMGKTVYQASFQDGPDGQPIASIFSINDDPGRWIKYLGSLIISFGVIWLFYDKRRSARAIAPTTMKEDF